VLERPDGSISKLALKKDKTFVIVEGE